jgi:hypothetical protein
VGTPWRWIHESEDCHDNNCLGPVDLEGLVSPEKIGRWASLRVGIHSTFAGQDGGVSGHEIVV